MGLGAACLCGALACGTQTGPNPPAGVPRSFRMGFSALPPRADPSLVLPVINLWSRRADAAIMSQEPPWADLLGGADPGTLVARDQLPLASYFRARGHRLWVYLDPGNGLNRAGEADALVRAGRSITEPAVQALFRRYAAALDTIVRPEHMGLALETNLIRGLSPPALYAAIRRVANDAAADVRALDPVVALSVSVQVDYAWGRAAGAFEGVATDLADFPFVQELGLSSYPYLAGFLQPEQIPLDYYSRLTEGRALPVMVTEGGWTSASFSGITSSPDEQQRYIARHLQILDATGATAVFQLTFTDLDLTARPQAPGSIIPFASLGLVDANLTPKPALAVWDAGFARPRR